MTNPYNPLHKTNLGNSVAEALLTVKVAPLSATAELDGAGVYAIYYTGNFPAYQPIARKNREGQFSQPIYVGKAVPKGARKGGLSYDASKGAALRDRLRQHASSIDQAQNIHLVDFFYRSLVVDDIWIPLGENMMIERFKPIWNVQIDGFGNKDPGRRRAGQFRSNWDVLHPGRDFAEKLATSPITPETLLARLDALFSGKEVPEVPLEDAADIGSAEED